MSTTREELSRGQQAGTTYQAEGLRLPNPSAALSQRVANVHCSPYSQIFSPTDANETDTVFYSSIWLLICQLFRVSVGEYVLNDLHRPVMHTSGWSLSYRRHQETTVISTKRINPSKLEDMLEDIFRGSYVVELRHDTFTVVAERRLSQEEIQSCAW